MWGIRYLTEIILSLTFKENQTILFGAKGGCRGEKRVEGEEKLRYKELYLFFMSLMTNRINGVFLAKNKFTKWQIVF